MKRTRVLCSALRKKDTTLEVELNELLEQLYRKNVKPEVREFIEELESDEEATLVHKETSNLLRIL